MNLVLIGDVGVLDGMIHIGDEAMFDEALHQLRRRSPELRVTAISANPAETAERYGVAAIERVGFTSGASFDRAADEERMRRVALTAAGTPGLLPADDPAHAVIAAVRAADGVLVTGGGNLASTWPLHVFERATLGLIAEAVGRPFVVSGQTIGPDLGDADAALVARMLASARLVGLRERDSYRLTADRLGVPRELLNHTVDDASFVGDRAAPGADAAGYCAVSLSPHLGGADRGVFVERTAALLDAVAAETGLAIVFLAHFGSLQPEVVRGDSVLHEDVRAAMRTPSSVVPPTDSVAAAALAREASFVVSSRYHPAVFAASGGVPILGIAVDDYTTTKLTGALGTFGQAAARAGEVPSGVLQITELVGDDPERATDVAAALWADRDRIRSTGLATAVIERERSARWWDRVAGSLR